MGPSHSSTPAIQCHIDLHEEAGNVDIVKGTLALALLRRRLVEEEDDSYSLECPDHAEESGTCGETRNDLRLHASQI